MNTRIGQMSAGVIIALLGIFLFTAKSDSQFAKLTPTEESKYLVPMLSGNVYDQDIVVQNKNISRIGMYLLPLHPLSGHVGIISMSLMRGDTVLESVDVSSTMVTSNATTDFVFAFPLSSAVDEVLRMRITVSDGISTDIALRNRIVDNDFSGEGITAYINGATQELPYAYTASQVLHPSLMKQLGGAIIALGIVCIFLPYIRRHRQLFDHAMLAVVALLQSFSAGISQTSQIMYGFVVFLILVFAWWACRIAGRTRVASLFTAGIIAGSSWVPLLLISSNERQEVLAFKDVFLDPNQIAVSHASGAYIGFFALFFAIIGLVALVVRLVPDTRKRVIVDVAVALLLIASLPFSHILTAMGLAWFAGLGLDAVQRFLGLRDKLAQALLMIVVAIALLDIMHVASVTLAYGSL